MMETEIINNAFSPNRPILADNVTCSVEQASVHSE